MLKVAGGLRLEWRGTWKQGICKWNGQVANTKGDVGLRAGHKIDTLGGVFCFLGCPRTPKSQTGCPQGHPKILQGCPFYTPKKLRVSPVLVGPMTLNFLLINFFQKKFKKTRQGQPALLSPLWSLLQPPAEGPCSHQLNLGDRIIAATISWSEALQCI